MEKIFDTHAHYFDAKFNEIEGGADAILSSEEFRNTVSHVVNVGAIPSDPYVSIELAKRYDFIYSAVGIHPSDAQNICKDDVEGSLAVMEGLIATEESRRENKIVAVGEIGFDYYWQPVDRELQRVYFDEQMKLAEELDLPVIIHDREAHADTLEMIKSHPNVVGVLHSCSMSAEMVKEIVKLGWYASFSGPLTYKNAQRVREACAVVPLDRLLVETDAPYLSPVPYRGKINNSVYMQSTVGEMARIHGKDFDEMAHITANNARVLFKI
jgi:TatD DNase family protein